MERWVLKDDNGTVAKICCPASRAILAPPPATIDAWSKPCCGAVARDLRGGSAGRVWRVAYDVYPRCPREQDRCLGRVLKAVSADKGYDAHALIEQCG